MPVADLLQAYKNQVTADISQETTPDTLDPDLIGSMGTDLADILMGELPKQNRFFVSSGTTFPIGGNDTDLYYQSIVNGIKVFRNINGVWTLLTTIPIGVSLPDGIFVGLKTSISGDVVTVSSGAWIIDNTKYSIATQTQFTLPYKDPPFAKWSLIYADKNNQILMQSSGQSTTPIKPTLPVDCILVDYAYQPAFGGGGPPYLEGGQTVVTVSNAPLPVLASDQTAGIYTLIWDDARKINFGDYGRFFVEQANTYQTVPIKINKDVSTNKPISYEFDLSNIDTLIHIL